MAAAATLPPPFLSAPDACLFLPLVDKYIAMAKEKHGYNIEQVRSEPGRPLVSWALNGEIGI